jgi:hypothetical protein
MEPAPTSTPVERLVGVYHADGTVIGELRYWVGARLGRAHCALCDITHGTFRAKPEWVEGRDGLGVHFETVHLDEREADVAAATGDRTPCVVALTGDRWVELLGPDELEECHGSVPALFAAIRSRATELGLALGPDGPPADR